MLRTLQINRVKQKLAETAFWLVPAVVVLSLIAPIVLMQQASGAQLVQRRITMSSSHVSQTGVTYSFAFRPTVTTNILGIAVQFCQNSPLPDSACTTTNGVTGTPADIATVVVSHNAQNVTFDVDDLDSNQADATLLTHITGLTTVITTADITFTFTVTNPSGTSGSVGAVGSFYARLATYSTVVNAQTFDPATGVMGTELDQGGVALSTARRLTVNARVQEELEFCVGVTDNTVVSNATSPANCAAGAFAGTTPTVDIGVVTSTVSSVSPVAIANGGNLNNGAFLIRTNAANGVAVVYYAIQETGSGRLKVLGATCNLTGGASTLDAGSGNQDQCFNSNADQDVAGNDFSTAGEKFGMTISDTWEAGTTNNLTRDLEYDGDGVPATAGGDFAWKSDGTSTTIATSSTVLDYESAIMRFAGRSAATTPTGAYTVLSTYVATSNF